jgi:hypothetical protein
MVHRETATAQQVVPEPQYRCACCEGIIENLSNKAIPSGLDLKLGYFSDECVLICNACTSRLIEANSARPTHHRR